MRQINEYCSRYEWGNTESHVWLWFYWKQHQSRHNGQSNLIFLQYLPTGNNLQNIRDTIFIPEVRIIKLFITPYSDLIPFIFPIFFSKDLESVFLAETKFLMIFFRSILLGMIFLITVLGKLPQDIKGSFSKFTRWSRPFCEFPDRGPQSSEHFG